MSMWGRCCAGALILASGVGAGAKSVVPPATQITTGDAEWFWPTWSPDGREILASAKQPGGDSEIKILRSDGGGLRTVGHGPTTDRHPRWVGNDLIAFDSDRHGKYDLFVVRADGSALSRLTSHAADDAAAFPSPDGRWIAYTSNRTGRWALHIMRPDGSGERQLADLPKHIYSPAWSADAKRIVFMTAAPNSDLYDVDVESAAVRPFVATDVSEGGVRWSPDGARLVYVRGDGPNRELMIIGADGTGSRRVDVPSGELSWLTWCPDNKRVVFTRTEAGNEDVYAVDVDDGRVARLTDHPSRDTSPSCGPGGRVVFGSARAPAMNLFVVPIP